MLRLPQNKRLHEHTHPLKCSCKRSVNCIILVVCSSLHRRCLAEKRVLWQECYPVDLPLYFFLLLTFSIIQGPASREENLLIVLVEKFVIVLDNIIKGILPRTWRPPTWLQWLCWSQTECFHKCELRGLNWNRSIL